MTNEDILNYVTETPGNTNRAVLGSMLNQMNNGTALPEVDAEDNGKVLTVVDGVWAKAEASGGGALYVDFTYDNGTQTYSANHSYAEVKAAIEDGSSVIGRYLWEDSYGSYSKPLYIAYTYETASSPDYSEFTFKEVPAMSVSNNKATYNQKVLHLMGNNTINDNGTQLNLKLTVAS